MEFRIKHESKLFHYGIVAPWTIAGAACLLFIGFGFQLTDETATMVFAALLAVCGASVIICSVLFVIEIIFGAKIIIESDHVDIRMLLRHKRFYYDKIVEAKYSHYYDDAEDSENGGDSYGGRLRSQLAFTLISGKVFRLNDKPTGYQRKRNLWITHPEIDPDEDVKLYQAYRCYCSAHDSYMNALNGNTQAAVPGNHHHTMGEI